MFSSKYFKVVDQISIDIILKSLKYPKDQYTTKTCKLKVEFIVLRFEVKLTTMGGGRVS